MELQNHGWLSWCGGGLDLEQSRGGETEKVMAACELAKYELEGAVEL